MPDTDTKTLLIKGKAGLGNRILSTLTGMVYGQMSSRRIIVDWSDGAYAAKGINAFPLLFSSPVFTPDMPIPQTNDVTPPVWRDHLTHSVEQMIGTYDPKRFSDPTIYRKYCCDLADIDLPQTLAVYWSYLPKFRRIRRHFKGQFAHLNGMSESRIIAELLPEFITPLPVITGPVDQFVSKHFKAPVIGVHVRHSDRKSPIEKICRSIDRLLMKEPGSQIFLATDNRAVENDLKSRYQNIIVTEKWLPSPGEAIHYNKSDIDPTKSAIEALIDIYLLARCDYLIYPGGSTFSYLARCIGDFPSSRVMDVEAYDAKVQIKRAIHNLL